VTFTLLSYLDESIAGHVLHSVVGLVHELEQLVHYSLQELPVLSQKSEVGRGFIHPSAGNPKY
jgi:hypothetical protein